MTDVKLEVIGGITLPEYKNPEEMLDRIAEFFKSGAKNVKKRFTEPSDDWEPMYLVVLDKDNAQLITGIGDKYAMVRGVAAFASEVGAIGIGQLNSSWRKIIKDGRIPKGSIAENPESEEGLMLALFSRVDWRVEWAPIKRHRNKPPLLGLWELMMERKGGEDIRGMMFDPLLKALRKN